jgi:hypothetical protein
LDSVDDELLMQLLEVCLKHKHLGPTLHQYLLGAVVPVTVFIAASPNVNLTNSVLLLVLDAHLLLLLCRLEGLQLVVTYFLIATAYALSS